MAKVRQTAYSCVEDLRAGYSSLCDLGENTAGLLSN